MKLLPRYIAKTVLASIALVTLMLAGLQVFILFVNQLDDLGKADYGLAQAAVFVCLQMPYQVYMFFPMASLLGSLIGLGMMANYSELIVMRAAGMSIAQISIAVMKAAFLLIMLVTVLGETLVPRMAFYANDYKMSKVSSGQAMRTARGVWLRHNDSFISISNVLPDHSLEDVYQFQFDAEHRMKASRFIKKIIYQDDHWQAFEVDETLFLDKDQTKARHVKSMSWTVKVNPKLLGISGTEPDEMTLLQLHRYIQAQKSSGLGVLNYQLAYWQRLVQPLTTLVMMLLAIPFIFGPLRSSTMGSKFLAGAIVGFGFYIVNRFFGPVSMVYQLPAQVAALGPTFIFCLLGLYLMRRVK